VPNRNFKGLDTSLTNPLKFGFCTFVRMHGLF